MAWATPDRVVPHFATARSVQVSISAAVHFPRTGWKGAFRGVTNKAVKFVHPTAPEQPVTIQAPNSLRVHAHTCAHARAPVP